MNILSLKSIKLFIIINILIVNQFYYKNYSLVKTKSNNNIINNNYKIFNIEFNEFNFLRKKPDKINGLKILDLIYSYSFKFNMIKIEYSIGLYDEKENLISPTDASLYYNISLLCNIIIEYYNISIDSLANIKRNKYFNCIEFYNINEKITLGIKIIIINNKFN